MLILTRKEGEAVVIPRALVRVTVTRIDGNRVRLGFESPHGFDVLREELISNERSDREDEGSGYVADGTPEGHRRQ